VCALPEQALGSLKLTLECLQLPESKFYEHRNAIAVMSIARLHASSLPPHVAGTQLFYRAKDFGLVCHGDKRVPCHGDKRVPCHGDVRVPGCGHCWPRLRQHQVVASRSFTLDEWCIMNKEAERFNAMRGVEP
jgi:hypothetical protein